MAALTKKKQKLSNNYRGWRSNGKYHSTINDEQDTAKPMSARHRNNKNQYSDEEKLARQTTAIFSKLTPDKKNCLLPKIIAIYKKIDTQQKLETFLSVIFESATASNVFQSVYIDIFTQLLPSQNNDIANISNNEFKKCVLKLCIGKFQQGLDKSNGNNSSYGLWDVEWSQVYKKKALLSITQFIGKLTAKRFVDLAMSLKFINVLYEDEKNENNIEAICGIFGEINQCISQGQDGRVALKNADMHTIDVPMRTHLLVYGYIRRYDDDNNMARCIVNVCIGYYDIDCYLFGYYQKLQRIGDDMNYGMRIRMLIQNLRHC